MGKLVQIIPYDVQLQLSSALAYSCSENNCNANGQSVKSRVCKMQLVVGRFATVTRCSTL